MKHISYFHGIKDNYVQVTGNEKFSGCLSALGFVLSVDDLPDELAQPEIGAPANGGHVEDSEIKDYDTQALFDSFDDKDQIVDFMAEKYGVTISKHGNLGTVKEKALEHINSLPGVNGGTNES